MGHPPAPHEPPQRSSGNDACRTEDGSPPRFRLRGPGREVIVDPHQDLLIGRAPECHLPLTSGLVSRRHARVRHTDDGLVIEDLESRNGIFVNQRRITEETRLVHGDTVGVGLETFEVVDEHVLRHAAHLSTVPPASAPLEAGRRGLAPPGHADVDAPEEVTHHANLDVLSAREREVLELIVLGYTQREIAQRLFVSVKTVETHRAHLAAKLECRTRAELVTYALSARLMDAALMRNAREPSGRGNP